MLQKIFSFFKKKNKPRRISKAYEGKGYVYTPVNNLIIGMFVAELDIPWLESPFPFQGFTIESKKELQMLMDTCQFVYVDISKQKKERVIASSKKDVVHEKFAISEPLVKQGTFETEIDRATDNYQEAGALVDDFMDGIAKGRGVDGTLAKEAVASCVNSVLHSPDAFLWLSQLKSKDKYTAQHSLNVCVLSILLGRQVGMTDQLLNHVGLCGMMHDMGKMLVPLEILNKPGKLEPDELVIMQSHTTLGYDLLKDSPNIFYGATEAAYTHHERHDGKGYPRGINSNTLSFYSNIVAIADMYDAITSDRVYQKGRTHLEATKILLEMSGGHLDSQLVVKFIESLGIYPPGSFVKLNNGSIALVIESNIKLKLRPKIMLLLDKEGNSLKEVIVDLSKVMEDAFGSPLIISSIIKPDTYNIDSAKYYHQGVVQKGFSMVK